MVKSAGNGSSSSSVPPFLKKCYEMVDDEATNSIISWSDTDDSFVIWDTTQFSVQLLPQYFKHGNFSSFMRQLNIYGFRKSDTDRWEFSNDGFVRGQKHLLKNISRRKHPQVPDQKKSSQQQDSSIELCEKIENLALRKEVENLKTDKNVLMQEFVKLRQHQETAENKLLVLRETMQGMEKDQQQMLSFLVMAMQNPGILVQLMQPKENNWHVAENGNNMLEQDTQDGEPVFSDGVIVRYQLPVDGTLTPEPKPSSASEKPPESISSCDAMNDIFMNVDFMEVLMDEKLRSLESPAPFILPDIDDCSWEQLLFASPFLKDVEETEQDEQHSSESGMEIESTGCGTQLEKSLIDSTFKRQGLKKSQNLKLPSSN